MSKPPSHLTTSIYETSHLGIMQRFSTPKNFKLSTYEMRAHFPSILHFFSDSYLVHEMSLRQKGTYAPPQDKVRGLNIHDANEPLAPYDQNKLSNHKLRITKPLKHVKII
jgi:hypothetical protein